MEEAPTSHTHGHADTLWHFHRKDTGVKENPNFTSEQRQALQHVAQELRLVLEHMTTLNGTADELDAIADQVKALSNAMAPMTGNKALEHFALEWGDDLNSPLPMSPITGRYHPVAPPVELSMEGSTLVGTVSLNKVYEGGPGWVHGSWIAAIYDQLLAFAGIFNKTGGPTASLTVDFMKPTPINTPLRFEATIDSVADKKIYMSGRCYCEGQLVTKCEALFIQQSFR